MSEGAAASSPFPATRHLFHRIWSHDLVAASDRADGAIAVAQSADVLHHVTALWPVALADALAAAVDQGERKIGDWAARQGIVPVPFDLVSIDGRTIDPFFNVNTPDDFLEAAALMQLVRFPKSPP